MIFEELAIRIIRKIRGALVDGSEFLYYSLPDDDRNKVLTGKTVVDIKSDDTGVSVACSDGTTYTGSMIIGADSVHSITRRTMRKLALVEDPKREWGPSNPFVAEYNTAWFLLPSAPQRNSFDISQGQNRSVIYATREKSCVFLCSKLTHPTSERVRYAKKDLEEYVKQLADQPITEELSASDVIDLPNAGMANLEEGVVKNWSLGRIVLVGDVCHKVISNAGQGYQVRLQDVVALANYLRRALLFAPSGNPDLETLEGTFDEYKSLRMGPVQQAMDLSEKAIRMHTWASWVLCVLTRYVMTWDFIMRRMIQKCAPRMARVRVLEYVPTNEPVTGRVEWVYSMPKPSDAGDSSAS